jgi:aerobic-type carbon monoxide dehydrogenase small subunit (CoxS/CutS family)
MWELLGHCRLPVNRHHPEWHEDGRRKDGIALAMVTLQVNGRKHQLDISHDMPLLWVLRDALGLTGTKFGCGVALCGACTVHIDGRAIRSCITRAGYAMNKNVTTIVAEL